MFYLPKIKSMPSHMMNMNVTDETIEKILPILEINEPDLDLNGNDSSYKLGIN